MYVSPIDAFFRKNAPEEYQTFRLEADATECVFTGQRPWQRHDE